MLSLLRLRRRPHEKRSYHGERDTSTSSKRTCVCVGVCCGFFVLVSFVHFPRGICDRHNRDPTIGRDRGLRGIAAAVLRISRRPEELCIVCSAGRRLPKRHHRSVNPFPLPLLCKSRSRSHRFRRLPQRWKPAQRLRKAECKGERYFAAGLLIAWGGGRHPRSWRRCSSTFRLQGLRWPCPLRAE